MKVTGLEHKHGGKITDVFAIGHETYKKVATWHYVCRVEWPDDSVTARDLVAPWAVCFDHANDQAKADYAVIATALDSYLQEFGEWLEEPKHMRDGRVVQWVAKGADHEQPIEECRALASAA